MNNKELPVVGWIGTGVMGKSMLGHLLTKGYKAFVNNRTKEKSIDLIKNGAVWCETPGDVARVSDVVFTMVGFPNDVREVYFSPNGILNSIKSGSVIVDMTTTSPSLAVEIYENAKVKKVSSLDAPVSGGDVGARNATLSIMVGGEKETFENILPIFNILGKKIVYQGKSGSGQHTKMCNQIQIAGTMIGMCESLIYGYKAGLDPETVLLSIADGAAACWSLQNLAPRVIKGDFEPGFFVQHFIKDMAIALEEAERMKISLPGLSLVHQLYQTLSDMGYSRKGTQALILALEKMSGIPNHLL